jgi:hypothetical protein
LMNKEIDKKFSIMPGMANFFLLKFGKVYLELVEYYLSVSYVSF